MRQLVSRLIYRPQRVWIRRANFQIHLWLGLILTLYLIVIGLTGSILVFRDELEPTTWQKTQLTRLNADIVAVLHNVAQAYPTSHLISIETPTKRYPVFLTLVQGHRGRTTVIADASTGAVLGELHRRKTWLSVVSDLHITLLAGPKGRAANGIGGALLLLINLTGMVIWWPGLRAWKRGFKIDFQRRWRRINFDTHSAVGFWTLSIVLFWAISGLYFGWSRQVFDVVNRISPVISAKPPVVKVETVGDPVKIDLAELISRATHLDPGARLAGLAFPYSRRAPYEIFMLRGNRSGLAYTDTLYFNPWNGAYIQTWRYGVNQSLGDWFIWSQVPLHYGTYWGLGVKVVWALLGLAIPLLAVTGVILYWNRYLRHKWRRLSNPS